MGRKTKLTPDVEEDICQAVSLGLTYRDAALLVGVTDRSIHGWIERGRKSKSGIYFRFFHKLEAAKVKMKATYAEAIRKAALDQDKVTQVTRTTLPDGTIIDKIVETTRPARDWKAALAALERRFPEEWGPRHRVEHEGGVSVQQPVVVKFIGGGPDDGDELAGD